MMITLFVDGSYTKLPQRQAIVAWGIIATHDGERKEHSGKYECGIEANGFHEFVAFIEAYKYAKEQGFKPEEMSFFVDCDRLGYANFYMHEGNYKQSAYDSIYARLCMVCNMFYKEVKKELVKEILHCLVTSRITKVKSHRNTVYNLRADYIAKCARNPTKKILPFEDWLAEGFVNYTAEGPFTWYAPFAREHNYAIL